MKKTLSAGATPTAATTETRSGAEYTSRPYCRRSLSLPEVHHQQSPELHHRKSSQNHQQQPTPVYVCSQDHHSRPLSSHSTGRRLSFTLSSTIPLFMSNLFSSNSSSTGSLNNSMNYNNNKRLISSPPPSPGATRSNSKSSSTRQLPIHRSDSSHRLFNNKNTSSAGSSKRSQHTGRCCTYSIHKCLAVLVVWVLFVCIFLQAALDGYHRVLDLSQHNSTTAMASELTFMPDSWLRLTLNGGVDAGGGGGASPHGLWKLIAAATPTNVAARPLTAKQQQRRDRTRPPNWTAVSNSDGSTLTSTSTLSWLQSSSSSLQQRKTVQVDWKKNDNWQHELCKKANVDENSRIVIANLLSQPAASVTALFLHQQCNVTQLAGTDALFPNLRLTRMRYLQVYQVLLQKIPTLQFIMTGPDGGLACRKASVVDNSFALDNEWLYTFAPTHVLLMETAPLFANDRSESIMSAASYRLYAMKKSMALWTDIMRLLSQQQHPPHILHVTSTTTTTSVAANVSDIDNPISEAARQVFTSTWPAMLMADDKTSMTSLKLPPLYGPWVTNLESNLWKNETTRPSTSTTIGMDGGTSRSSENKSMKTPHLYVDDAIMAILAGMRAKSTGLYQVYIPADRTVPLDDLMTSLQTPAVNETMGNANIQETLSWKSRLEYPFGGMQYQHVTPPRWWKPPAQSQFVETYGLQPTRMPCSTQCTEPGFTCTPSVFDEDVLKASRKATAGCHFVMYMSAFDDNVTELHGTQFPEPEQICRIAYVSVHAPIVQANLKKRPARLWNGRVRVNNWKLVWLNIKGGDRSLNDGDFGLLRIDPSRLFAPSVAKVMHVSNLSFAAVPDSRIYSFMNTVDQERPRQGATVRDQRPGTQLKRWLAVPDEPPRRVALFGGAPPEKPASVNEYLDRVAAKYGISKKDRNNLMPRQQLSFYKQVAHLVHVNEDRPEFEVQRTLYKKFPFEWTADIFFVHDMSMEESRVLRCRWFEEYLGWGNNRHVIDLSLAYILAELRTSRQLGWTKTQLEEQLEWSPLLAPPEFDEGEEPRVLTVKNGDGQIFLRLLQPKDDAA